MSSVYTGAECLCFVDFAMKSLQTLKCCPAESYILRRMQPVLRTSSLYSAGPVKQTHCKELPCQCASDLQQWKLDSGCSSYSSFDGFKFILSMYYSSWMNWCCLCIVQPRNLNP